MRKTIAVLALSLLAAHVMAAVSPEEAAKLGTTLTPVGAEKAGNADGSIPAWTGGIPKNAGAVDSKGFLADPFASEKPLFVITAATVDKYKDKLSDGQVAMFKRYPETYKIPVYPSHRTVNLPPDIYESIKRSALNVKAINDGNGLENFTGNRYYAFPIPKNGVEVLWNHITRYHGGNLRRIITQATPQTNGSYTPIRFEEEVAVPQAIPDIDQAKAANVLSYFKQSVTAPARLAGRSPAVGSFDWAGRVRQWRHVSAPALRHPQQRGPAPRHPRAPAGRLGDSRARRPRRQSPAVRTRSRGR